MISTVRYLGICTLLIFQAEECFGSWFNLSCAYVIPGVVLSYATLDSSHSKMVCLAILVLEYHSNIYRKTDDLLIRQPDKWSGVVTKGKNGTVVCRTPKNKGLTSLQNRVLPWQFVFTSEHWLNKLRQIAKIPISRGSPPVHRPRSSIRICIMHVEYS